MKLFELTEIDYVHVGLNDALFTDYVTHNSSIKPFVSFFPDFQNIPEVIQQKRLSLDQRLLLQKSLQKQYELSGISAPKSIDKLSSLNTFTVCTGHQLGIYTGPVFFIYKICTIIKLSKYWNNQFADYQFLPVFWMASEDHDFDEIKSIHVFNKTITWNKESKGPVGRISLEDIQPLTQYIKEILGSNISYTEIKNIIEECYQSTYTLSQATRRFLHKLFSEYDLLIIDGDDAELKKSFHESITLKDIEYKYSYTHVKETSEKLQNLGYSPQAYAREVNFFHITPQEHREKILLKDGKFYLEQTHQLLSLEEFKKYILQFPKRISPNVITRPLYQEFLLPNIAYIAGPSELRYWLQLKSVFDVFKIPMPAIYMRDVFCIVQSKDKKKLEKLNLSYTEICKSYEELEKNYIQSINQTDFSNEKKELFEIWDTIVRKTTQVDVTLKASAMAEKIQLEKSIAHLEKKIIQAEKKKHEQDLQHIKQIKSKLFPEKIFQERYVNVLEYISKYGVDFIEDIIKTKVNKSRSAFFLTEKTS